MRQLLFILICVSSASASGAVRSVSDFGARPNDGADDRAAIISAINALGANDVLAFGEGEYNISATIFITKNDYTLLGVTGKTVLKGVGATGDQIQIKGDRVALRGLTFSGGGVFLDKPSGFNDRISFDFCRFNMAVPGGLPHRDAIHFTSGLSNSAITNCYFTGYNSGFAIYGYNYNGLTIANNEIVNTDAGMHIAAFGNSGNLLVEQNHITGTKGMGMEFQGTATNLVFQDNWYENPKFPATTNTMAYSLIMDRGVNSTIRRNVHISPAWGGSPWVTTGDFVRVVFEVGGDNTLIEDNYSDGGGHVVADNDGIGTGSVMVRNNKFLRFANGPYISFPTSTRTLTQSNNGPNVTLSAAMEARLAAGQRPGIGPKRYATTPPATQPTKR